MRSPRRFEDFALGETRVVSQRLLLAVVTITAVSLTGCVSYPRAQNPLPGVYRIAVVDFVDKTNGAEGVDTRKITEIFASELQKVPTYEVVPVQEVREVLGPQRIDTNQPQLAFELARALHVQAIIVGSVNEYSAYYPPRVGLHCEMYAMVTGQPEAIVQSPAPVMEENRRPLQEVMGPLADVADPFQAHDGHGHGHGLKNGLHKLGCGKCAGCRAGGACSAHSHGGGLFHWRRHRFQTEITDTSASPAGPVTDAKAGPPNGAGASADEVPVPLEPNARRDGNIRKISAEEFTPSDLPDGGVVAPTTPGESTTVVESTPAAPATQAEFDAMIEEEPILRGPGHRVVEPAMGTSKEYLAGQIADYQISIRAPIDPIPVVEPWVIRHSRVFDGTNLGLVRKLKDYYFFKRDIRGGEWQGYVMRNDDYTRFACNQMIYEMLQAAGGDWITLRGLRLPEPYYPWPPR